MPEIKKLTANDIKESFTRRAYFDGHIIASEADRFLKPDLLTITRNLRACEYEIKVSLADLRKELMYIEAVIEDQKNHVIFNSLNIPLFNPDATLELDRSRKFKTYDNKYRKHRAYQFYGFEDTTGIRVPNRFYFLIPKELYEKEKERIDAIPFYGVVDANTFYNLKLCKPIHNETMDALTIWYAAQNIQGRYLMPPLERTI